MEIRAFAADEGGAVTVDWVVLTAALVGLGLATVAVVSGGLENLSTNISQDLANIDIAARWTNEAAVILGLLYFDTQAAADQEVASILSQVYRDDPQYYYDSIQSTMEAFIELGQAPGLAYEADVLAGLERYTAANGIEIDTTGGMTLAEAHAAHALLLE